MQEDWSLLHFAAYGGNVDLVDWLIESLGLDIHQRTKVLLYCMHFLSTIAVLPHVFLDNCVGWVPMFAAGCLSRKS